METITGPVRITELLPTGRDTLVDVDFVDAQIVGPAVLVLGNTRFEGNTLLHRGAGTESLVWEVDDEVRPFVIGAIGLQGCSFTRCTFSLVGFAGPSDEIHKLLQGHWLRD
ncbi:hypothetical protein SAMN04487783_2098 [Agrococcus baldri]|uniref:Uncharacterized protein n=1 Tax=Agrococcus baldri TaxID=153730 RepID=A0AA94HPK4_9MICO|nr:hypothetical protein [Agrococcus baldri]SFS15667.1 hypothetical protein SAMN04487783_2098 [Agrococcus baldri]